MRTVAVAVAVNSTLNMTTAESVGLARTQTLGRSKSSYPQAHLQGFKMVRLSTVRNINLVNCRPTRQNF